MESVDPATRERLEQLRAWDGLFETLYAAAAGVAADSDALAKFTGGNDGMQELVSAARAKLKQMRESMEELEVEAEAQEREADSVFILELLNKARRSLNDLQDRLREAMKQYSENVREQRIKEREALLSGATSSELRRREPRSGEDSLAQAQEATDGLRRTRQMLAEAVSQGSATMALLDQSSQTLRATGAKQEAASDSIGTARGLITGLEQKEARDRAMMMGAFAFFVFVCFYILYRRLPSLGLLSSSPAAP
eukprot:tig00000113_g5707.t1